MIDFIYTRVSQTGPSSTLGNHYRNLGGHNLKLTLDILELMRKSKQKRS